MLAIIRGDVPALRRTDNAGLHEKEKRRLKAEEKRKFARLYKTTVTENRSEAELHEFKLRLELALCLVPMQEVDTFVVDALEAAKNPDLWDRAVALRDRETIISSLVAATFATEDEVDNTEEYTMPSSVPVSPP